MCMCDVDYSAIIRERERNCVCGYAGSSERIKRQGKEINGKKLLESTGRERGNDNEKITLPLLFYTELYTCGHAKNRFSNFVVMQFQCSMKSAG